MPFRHFHNLHIHEFIGKRLLNIWPQMPLFWVMKSFSSAFSSVVFRRSYSIYKFIYCSILDVLLVLSISISNFSLSADVNHLHRPFVFSSLFTYRLVCINAPEWTFKFIDHEVSLASFGLFHIHHHFWISGRHQEEKPLRFWAGNTTHFFVRIPFQHSSVHLQRSCSFMSLLLSVSTLHLVVRTYLVSSNRTTILALCFRLLFILYNLAVTLTTITMISRLVYQSPILQNVNIFCTKVLSFPTRVFFLVSYAWFKSFGFLEFTRRAAGRSLSWSGSTVVYSFSVSQFCWHLLKRPSNVIAEFYS